MTNEHLYEILLTLVIKTDLKIDLKEVRLLTKANLKEVRLATKDDLKTGLEELRLASKTDLEGLRQSGVC